MDDPSLRALTTGRPVRDFVVGIETPDRGLRWLSVNAIPVNAAESPTVGVVSTFADVTDQRRALEQLQRERAGPARVRGAVPGRGRGDARRAGRVLRAARRAGGDRRLPL